MLDTSLHPNLRAYFAANAPADIPAWFKLTFRDPPPMPDPKTLTPQQLEQWNRVGDDIKPEDADPAVREFALKSDAARHARHLHERDLAEAIYFAWRWHYADQMMNLHQAANTQPRQPLAEHDLDRLTSLPLYEIWRGNTFDRYALSEPTGSDIFAKPVSRHTVDDCLLLYAFATAQQAQEYIETLDYLPHDHIETLTYDDQLTCVLIKPKHGRPFFRILDLRGHTYPHSDWY